MSFKDKVVIVTGSSAGIGAAIAIAFAKEGANTVLIGRNETNLQKVAKECEANGRTPLVIVADVIKESDLDKIITETIVKFGKLDILVNNAGIFRSCSLEEGTFSKAFDEVLATNLRPVIQLTERASLYLIASKGTVVNISSIAGARLVNYEFTVYGMLKAALDYFTKGAALELGKHGVRVNTVSPGPVKTEINSANEIKIKTLLNRWSVSEEIADLVLFIASDKARGVTGSNYVVDNGCLLINK